ncbi:YraN family protein [Naumannella sp. ID2617S]|nr:YraN family protein [Naumannella sp. ID2617S]
MTGSRQRLGARGEELAVAHLTAAGLVILDRNWRCRHGELDIVALDGEAPDSTLVFCEVKLRTGTGFGTPLEAITVAKVRRLRRLAGAWLEEHPTGGVAVRLDAIGILKRPGYAPEVTHVQGIG